MTHDARPTRTPRRKRIGLLALLLIPLLLVLHAPVLAAVVPTALLAVATFDGVGHETRHALPSAHVVDPGDATEIHRLAAAQPIAATTRRIA